MKFDHIGIVTPSLVDGRGLLARSIGIERWTREFEDPVNGVQVQFGQCGSGICYELIAPLGNQSPIASALRKRTNTINHVAYLVGDLAAEADRLAGEGFIAATQPNPAVAYGGKRIQFFLSATGMLIELIEAIGHVHDYALTTKHAEPV